MSLARVAEQSLIAMVPGQNLTFAHLNINGNGRNNQFGGGQRAVAPPTPLEEVTVVVNVSQIVKVLLPFMTARAASIRQWAQARLVDSNGRRLIVFRPEPVGWTNVDLRSVPENPLLTMEPVQFTRECIDKLGQSPDVLRVILKNSAEEVITIEQVEAMAFLPLVAAMPNPEPTPPPAVEINYNDLLAKVSQMIIVLDEMKINTAREARAVT